MKKISQKERSRLMRYVNGLRFNFVIDNEKLGGEMHSWKLTHKNRLVKPSMFKKLGDWLFETPMRWHATVVCDVSKEDEVVYTADLQDYICGKDLSDTMYDIINDGNVDHDTVLKYSICYECRGFKK